MKKAIIITSIAVLIFALTGFAHAQELVFKESGNTNFSLAQEISLGEKQVQLYGRTLRNRLGADVYAFNIEKPLIKYQIALFIPNKPLYSDFHPVFALVEPKGLKAKDLPFNPPKGYGVRVVNWKNPDKSLDYIDSLTKIKYWKGPSITKTLTKGKYYIAVYDPERNRGEYMIRFGKESKFSLSWMFSNFIPFVKARLFLY